MDVGVRVFCTDAHIKTISWGKKTRVVIKYIFDEKVQ